MWDQVFILSSRNDPTDVGSALVLTFKLAVCVSLVTERLYAVYYQAILTQEVLGWKDSRRY